MEGRGWQGASEMTRPTIGEERAARGSQHIALCALDVLRTDDIDPLTAQRRPADRSTVAAQKSLVTNRYSTGWIAQKPRGTRSSTLSDSRRPRGAPQPVGPKRSKPGRSADRAHSRGRVSGRRSALDERVDDALAARRDDADENHVYVLVERLGAANAAAHMSDCVLCERRGRQSQPRGPRLRSTGPVSR